MQIKGLVRITEGNPPWPQAARMGMGAVLLRHSPLAPTALCAAPLGEKEPPESMAERRLSMSDSSFETTHSQGSETGLSGKKTKRHQPESQQESGLLSLGLPINSGQVQQVFIAQHHHQKKPSHYAATTAARSYPGPNPSFTNTNICAALGNCLVKTCV